MFKVCTEWILGIRPTEEGLLVDPCIPSSWRIFKVRRKFRGTIYEIEVENPEGVNCGVAEVLLDGTPLDGHLLPPIGDGKVHKVSVRMGKVQPTAARP
jgi:cellobiose phosphorylase